MVVAGPSFLTTPKKTQQLILMFAVKTPPFTFVHRPSPPRKRQLMEYHGPGRPKKKLKEKKIGDRSGMMLQRVRAIVPLEYGSRTKLRSSTTTLLMKIVERPPILMKEFHATYTAERRF